MFEIKSTYLGDRIYAARKNCGLTQQELADQTGLSIKTIRDIERGRKNPTYETLARLIGRLGISANILFPSIPYAPNNQAQYLIDKIQSCDPQDQKILLRTMHFLAEQLRSVNNAILD